MNESGYQGILCTDYWPAGLPDDRVKVYRRLMDEKHIGLPLITYNATSGSALVEYRAAVPHEWILDMARKMLKEVEAGAVLPGHHTADGDGAGA